MGEDWARQRALCCRGAYSRGPWSGRVLSSGGEEDRGPAGAAQADEPLNSVKDLYLRLFIGRQDHHLERTDNTSAQPDFAVPGYGQSTRRSGFRRKPPVAYSDWSSNSLSQDSEASATRISRAQTAAKAVASDRSMQMRASAAIRPRLIMPR